MLSSHNLDYDYIIIGSGFGGSVSALRLSEKGYKVLVVEKGKWLKAEDFPKSNWNIRKWLWMPGIRAFGLFKMTFMRHVTIFSGVGVGGGSLVYANTLPIPKSPFFQSATWSHLANWERELMPFYHLAKFMLGATATPKLYSGDTALQQLSRELNKDGDFDATNVAVYFGQAGKTVSDPYFGGKGPDRTGCIYCGACMIGCRHDSKNTLDKNYLYLAQQNGAKIQAESIVYDVLPLGDVGGGDGYEVHWKSSTKIFGRKGKLTAKAVIFSGGVLGTVKLLLQLRKKKSLTRLSPMLGESIRTNSESLLGVVSHDDANDYSKGVAIGSILNLDEHSHLEIVRYPEGSGAFRLMMLPAVFSKSFFGRFVKTIWDYMRHPIANLKSMLVRDFGRSTAILLFMQTIDSTIKYSTFRP